MKERLKELNFAYSDLNNIHIIINAFLESEKRLKEIFKEDELLNCKNLIVDLTEHYTQDYFTVSKSLLNELI